MKDLNFVMEQMLKDFDEFERVFLQPYVPHSSFPPENRVSWIQQIEKHFMLPKLVEDVSETPDTPLLVIQTEHNNNIKVGKEDDVYNLMSLDNLPHLEIDTNILQEDVDKNSECCMAGKNGKKVCCNGKCWAYLESRWRKMEKIPRGRRKKGVEVNLELRELCKERQKIRNRLSAAEFYRKEKAYIQDLEMQVGKLQAENKIRRNLVKFLQSNLQLRDRKQPLERTMSLPLHLEYRVHRYRE